MNMPDTPAPTTEQDLDKALKDTFPASDPLSATAHLTATPTTDHLDAAERSSDHPGTVAIYRVVDEAQKEKPFAANGNKAGRWTSDGTPAVYASLSPAGALLEYLAHCDEAAPESAYLAKAHVPRDRMWVAQNYPSTWRDYPYCGDVQQVGDAWSRSHQSLAAQVPSALCDESCNVVINPEHVDAPLIQGLHVSPIRIDPRLRRATGG